MLQLSTRKREKYISELEGKLNATREELRILTEELRK
jgi:hypothetical protein